MEEVLPAVYRWDSLPREEIRAASASHAFARHRNIYFAYTCAWRQTVFVGKPLNHPAEIRNLARWLRGAYIDLRS